MLRRHPLLPPTTPYLDWDDRPLPYPWGRLLWLAATGIGFLLALGWSFGHDDPAPGLSDRGWATITLAAVLLVLLSIHRAGGPRRLARALAEYAVVALLAMLLATTSTDRTPAHHPTAAGVAGQHRPPAVVRAAAGVRDWLAGLWQQATRQADQPTPPTSTTGPTRRRAHALSPTATPPTRRSRS